MGNQKRDGVEDHTLKLGAKALLIPKMNANTAVAKKPALLPNASEAAPQALAPNKVPIKTTVDIEDSFSGLSDH